MSPFTVFDCNLIQLPKIHNRAGNITPVENLINLPFSVHRVYYLYDIPGGESRGAHGHIKLESLIVAVSGSFDVTLDDGRNKKLISVFISNPECGEIFLIFLLEPFVWYWPQSYMMSPTIFAIMTITRCGN
jgi:hypothetical protein